MKGEGKGYWWRRKRVKKSDLSKLPNGWMRIQYHKAAIMRDWLFWAKRGNRAEADKCRDATKEIDAILNDMESFMKEQGIGFIKLKDGAADRAGLHPEFLSKLMK